MPPRRGGERMPYRMRAAIAVVAIGLGACAAEVVRQQADFTPVAAAAARTEIEITEDVEVPVSRNYNRVLARGSRWQLVGTTPQGRVYRRGARGFPLATPPDSTARPPHTQALDNAHTNTPPGEKI